MKAVVFHEQALAELREALTYYESLRSGLGSEFRSEIEATVDRIRQNPQAYAIELEPHGRACPMRRFPFTLWFQELADQIWIAAIAHQRRRPGYWTGRTPN